MALPSQVVLSESQVFPVIQGPSRTLGSFNRDSGEIRIKEDQPEAGKHVILLHEMLHFVAEILVQGNVLKRQPPEAFMTHAAPILAGMLIRSGIWNGISAEEFDKFVEEQNVTC